MKKIISAIAVIEMVFATVVKFIAGRFDPQYDLPPKVWYEGILTKSLSFQHPTFFLMDLNDDIVPPLFGLFMVVITIRWVIKYNNNGNEWYLLGLIFLTVIRLSYWIPYLMAN